MIYVVRMRTDSIIQQRLDDDRTNDRVRRNLRPVKNIQQ